MLIVETSLWCSAGEALATRLLSIAADLAALALGTCMGRCDTLISGSRRLSAITEFWLRLSRSDTLDFQSNISEESIIAQEWEDLYKYETCHLG